MACCHGNVSVDIQGTNLGMSQLQTRLEAQVFPQQILDVPTMRPILVGLNKQQMYGNFEGIPLNSALFGLAIYSFPPNHGSGKWLCLKGNYY